MLLAGSLSLCADNSLLEIIFGLRALLLAVLLAMMTAVPPVARNAARQAGSSKVMGAACSAGRQAGREGGGICMPPRQRRYGGVVFNQDAAAAFAACTNCIIISSTVRAHAYLAAHTAQPSGLAGMPRALAGCTPVSQAHAP